MLKYNGNLSYCDRKIGSRIGNHYKLYQKLLRDLIIKKKLQKKWKLDHKAKGKHKRVA